MRSTPSVVADRRTLFGAIVCERSKALAARADDELPDPARRDRARRWRLRREALVVVVVPDEDDVGAAVVQRLPEGAKASVGAVRRPTRTAGGARRRACSRAGCAARSARSHCSCGDPSPQPTDVVAVRVERDDVPGAEVEAVVALPGGAGRRAEVVEVARRVRGAVLVVADGWSRDRLDAPPGRVVRRPERRERAALVLDVAEREHRVVATRHEQIGRLPLLAGVRRVPRLARDVPGSGDHGARATVTSR